LFDSEEKAKEAVIYSYNRHINGFAALLEEEEAADIASEHASFHRLPILLHFILFKLVCDAVFGMRQKTLKWCLCS